MYDTGLAFVETPCMARVPGKQESQRLKCAIGSCDLASDGKWDP